MLHFTDDMEVKAKVRNGVKTCLNAYRLVLPIFPTYRVS